MPSNQIRNREMEKNGDMRGFNIQYLCEVLALPLLHPQVEDNGPQIQRSAANTWNEQLWTACRQ
jgi:hypothetical protein